MTMPRRFQRTIRGLWAAGALGAALFVAAGCKTIHEEVTPLRETTLTVARSGGEVTLSWIGTQGMFYSVMFFYYSLYDGAKDKKRIKEQFEKSISGLI